MPRMLRRARTYVHRCTPVGVRSRGVHVKTEDQPPDPFHHRISGLPFLSLLASSYPFLPFFPAPRLLLFPHTRPVTACETIHLSSRSLVHGNGETWNRVGNNVPGKKPRRESRIFSGCLPARPYLSLARSLARRIPPFYFACLCREKGLGRGELSCRIQKDDRGRKREETEKETEREREREREREMIIHSAVITRSPAP